MPNANCIVAASRAARGGNALKIGLFGANCSSGRAVTKVPERWSGTWQDNLKLARMADAAGIDFMLPIGRWKGYGGDTDYQGATLETITWACGLLAGDRSASPCSAPCTRRCSIRSSRPSRWSPPITSARAASGSTSSSAGTRTSSRCSACEQREHATRYEYAQEWIDAIKLMWSDREEFDFDGKFIKLKKVRAKPKPYRRHAAGDHERGRVAGRPRLCAAQLRRLLHAGVARLGRRDRAARRRGEGRGAASTAARSASTRSASSSAGRP